MGNKIAHDSGTSRQESLWTAYTYSFTKIWHLVAWASTRHTYRSSHMLTLLKRSKRCKTTVCCRCSVVTLLRRLCTNATLNVTLRPEEFRISSVTRLENSLLLRRIHKNCVCEGNKSAWCSRDWHTRKTYENMETVKVLPPTETNE